MNALEIRGLCKHYGDFSLENVSLTLPGGCVMGLVGENGAGKSTLFRLILDASARDGGQVLLFGEDTARAPAHIRDALGVVFEGDPLPEGLTAQEIGRVLRQIYADWDEGRYRDWLRRFSIPEGRRYGQLSRGMKMLVELAAAISHGAHLLLLDEATSGLDPIMRARLLDVINDFTADERNAVLLSSHIVSDLEKCCDYIAFLHHGRLLLCEEKDRLLERYGVLHCALSELDALPRDALLGVQRNAYGVEAVVRRDAVSPALALGPVELEQLFVYLCREEGK